MKETAIGMTPTKHISMRRVTPAHRFTFHSHEGIHLLTLPAPTHRHIQNSTIGILDTKYGPVPVGKRVFIYKPSGPTVVPLADVRVGDCLISNHRESRELDGDHVPPAEVITRGLINGRRVFVRTLLIDILEIHIVVADVRQTSFQNRVSVLHSSGFYVAC